MARSLQEQRHMADHFSEQQTEPAGHPDPSASLVFTFPRGLPGFDQERRFRLDADPQLDPLVRLESLKTNGLSFLAAPVELLDPDYELQLSREDQEALGVPGGEPDPVDFLCLALLAEAGEGQWTANLLAPVVTYLPRGRSVQAVRHDDRYSHCHPLPGQEAAC